VVFPAHAGIQKRACATLQDTLGSRVRGKDVLESSYTPVALARAVSLESTDPCVGMTRRAPPFRTVGRNKQIDSPLRGNHGRGPTFRAGGRKEQIDSPGGGNHGRLPRHGEAIAVAGLALGGVHPALAKVTLQVLLGPV